MKRLFIVLLISMIAAAGARAQDFGFGFNEDSEEETELSPKSKPVTFKAGGKIAAAATPYFYDFSNTEDLADITLWNLELNLSLLSSHLDIITSFDFSTSSIEEMIEGKAALTKWNYSPLNFTPQVIDEAFLRTYMGPVNLEVGYRKLAWGKADINGPLDVINPIDYSDLRTISDIRENKIARPMVHLTWNTGSLSKLEGVFIPNFIGHRFADKGRWAPAQYSNMMGKAEESIDSIATEKLNSIDQKSMMQMMSPEMKLMLMMNPEMIQMMTPTITQMMGPFMEGLKDEMLPYFNKYGNEIPYPFPSTETIDYFQAGLRYTMTIGSADIGAQYFYGNLFRPNITILGIDEFFDDVISKVKISMDGMSPSIGLTAPIDPTIIKPQIKYNRYHQLGFDYAQILFDFNIRAEAAIFLTKDLKGDDGSIENPFVGWSLGFDRNLFAGINLNLQCSETIRLFNSKVGDNPVLDAEAGTSMVSTRISAQLSKMFLRDKLETSVTAIWDIENYDCYIMPAVIWSSNNFSAELSAGIFAGDSGGELGQYWKNSFLKVGISYSF